MKRLIVFLMMLTMIVSLSVGQKIYSSDRFAGRMLPNGEWSEWQEISVPVVWDFAERRIIIHTTDVQILDYRELAKKRYSNYYVYSNYATDSNYNVIKLEIYLYDSGTAIIKIIYSDFEYKYRLAYL